MTTATRMDSHLLDDWLEFIAESGMWGFVYWPGWKSPIALAGYRVWHELGLVDVFALLHEDFAFGYRALAPQRGDYLKPEHVLYVTEGTVPIDVLRAVVTLAGPAEPDAPDIVQPAPQGIQPVFRELGHRRVIRPPQERTPLPRLRLRPAPVESVRRGAELPPPRLLKIGEFGRPDFTRPGLPPSEEVRT